MPWPLPSACSMNGDPADGSSMQTADEGALLKETAIAPWPTVLIVDDDVSLGKFLKRELKRLCYTVDVIQDGEEACGQIERTAYSVVVLDLNLPKMDGMAVLKRVRLSQPELPILVLTARSSAKDRVSALEQGADDCLIKPFSFQELMARVKGLLRRHRIPSPSHSIGGGLKVGNLTMHREERSVFRDDKRIDLTSREFILLEYLMDNAGKTISRETLIKDVWNMPLDQPTNVVEVYMKYLRDKIDPGRETNLIRNIRGVGYVMSND